MKPSNKVVNYPAGFGPRPKQNTPSFFSSGPAGDGSILIRFPWPPSLNHIRKPVRMRNGKYRIGSTKEYTKWQNMATKEVQLQRPGHFPGGVALVLLLVVVPKTAHKRDLDNLSKAVQDVLVKAKVIADDSEITLGGQDMRPLDRANGGYVMAKLSKRGDRAIIL